MNDSLQPGQYTTIGQPACGVVCVHVIVYCGMCAFMVWCVHVWGGVCVYGVHYYWISMVIAPC